MAILIVTTYSRLKTFFNTTKTGLRIGEWFHSMLIVPTDQTVVVLESFQLGIFDINCLEGFIKKCVSPYKL